MRRPWNRERAVSWWAAPRRSSSAVSTMAMNEPNRLLRLRRTPKSRPIRPRGNQNHASRRHPDATKALLSRSAEPTRLSLLLRPARSRQPGKRRNVPPLREASENGLRRAGQHFSQATPRQARRQEHGQGRSGRDTKASRPQDRKPAAIRVSLKPRIRLSICRSGNKLREGTHP